MTKITKYDEAIKNLAKEYMRNIQALASQNDKKRAAYEDEMLENLKQIPTEVRSSLLGTRGKWGITLGMEAAKQRLEKIVCFALTDEESALIQDSNGWNLGRYAYHYAMPEATMVALQNKKIATQPDRKGVTLTDCVIRSTKHFACDDQTKNDLKHAAYKTNWYKIDYQHRKQDALAEETPVENVEEDDHNEDTI